MIRTIVSYLFVIVFLISMGYLITWTNVKFSGVVPVQTKTLWDYISMIIMISLIWFGSYLYQR